MKLTILKQEIEKTAKETGKTEIEVISAMQSHMASLMKSIHFRLIHLVKEHSL